MAAFLTCLVVYGLLAAIVAVLIYIDERRAPARYQAEVACLRLEAAAEETSRAMHETARRWRA
jgi:hypothetical protein